MLAESFAPAYWSHLQFNLGRCEEHWRRHPAIAPGRARAVSDEAGLTEAVQAKVPGISERNRSSDGTAVRRYRDLRDSRAAAPDSVGDVDDGGHAQLIGLEREPQAALRDRIHQLESGLVVIDGGVECDGASGFIDIAAESPDGTVVAIELKAGTAGRDAIGPILSYMGDVGDEETVGSEGSS